MVQFAIQRDNKRITVQYHIRKMKVVMPVCPFA